MHKHVALIFNNNSPSNFCFNLWIESRKNCIPLKFLTEPIRIPSDKIDVFEYARAEKVFCRFDRKTRKSCPLGAE